MLQANKSRFKWQGIFLLSRVAIGRQAASAEDPALEGAESPLSMLFVRFKIVV